MNSFADVLNSRLEALREEGLHRVLRRVDSPQSTHVRIEGQRFLNFSSNDYLGLANHPALREAALRATAEFGAGSGASRLTCGSLAPFHELEEALAEYKHTEAALSFATGYAAATGTLCALAGRADIVILDKLVHACLVDAARLSGAKLRVFAHNDVADLERILQWADKRVAGQARPPTILIVTESVFSMDGEAAPLREIVELKEKYGAWLMVDEAHATGLYGANQRGLAEELGVAERIEIQMSTLGKALGASGGFICGSRVLVEYLVNRARSFIFSTAPVPAAAAAATAAIRLIQSSEGRMRREALFQRVGQLTAGFRDSRWVTARPWGRMMIAGGFSSAGAQAVPAIASAIVPFMIGEASAAVAAAQELREQGIYLPAIRYPTVARGAARLRITLTAGHTHEDVTALLSALAALREVGAGAAPLAARALAEDILPEEL